MELEKSKGSGISRVFARGEDTHTLRRVSELSRLREEYADRIYARGIEPASKRE